MHQPSYIAGGLYFVNETPGLGPTVVVSYTLAQAVGLNIEVAVTTVVSTVSLSALLGIETGTTTGHD